jgi:xanthine/CO dehydrogenase XdhC/CoxF family maturation factor
MELTTIFKKAHQFYKEGKKTVLATIVDLDGSSYRKEGARMLMAENGQMTFALSGGCIEMEVFQKAQSVFETGQAKVIFYDGTVRLGCEGMLSILLEPISINEEKLNCFLKLIDTRTSFELNSWFLNEDDASENFGTILKCPDGRNLNFRNEFIEPEAFEILDHYQETVHPPFKLLLFGSGHDVEAFSQLAGIMDWNVQVIMCDQSPKSETDFQSACSVSRGSGADVSELGCDKRTAGVVMTHNFDMDLDYLQALLKEDLAYVGMIGSLKRRAKMTDRLLDLGFDKDLIYSVYTPAGLNIGAETPHEIALSILAEIQAVIKGKDATFLKNMPDKRVLNPKVKNG